MTILQTWVLIEPGSFFVKFFIKFFCRECVRNRNCCIHVNRRNCCACIKTRNSPAQTPRLLFASQIPPVSSALPAAFGLIALTSLCAQNQNTLAERLHMTQNMVNVFNISQTTQINSIMCVCTLLIYSVSNINIRKL